MKSKEVFDWAEYEELLYKGLEEAVSRLAKKYREIEFYGLCIDCNAEYGDVLLHLNTEENIIKNNKTSKWDVGDWGYFDVIDELEENDNFFSNLWEDKKTYCIDKMFPVEEEDEFDEGENPIEDFMIMISKVANRLKSSAAISSLKKTNDFRIVAADHDEAIEEGIERMEKLEKA